MNPLPAILSGVFILLAGSPAFADRAASSFSGVWKTTYGEMTLTAKGSEISGDYVMGGVENQIAGTIADGRLNFRYTEPEVSGEGWFELGADGATFAGMWRPDGADAWADWEGERIGKPSFAGLWNTNFGKLRIVEGRETWRGCYRWGQRDGTISGTLDGRKLTFEYADLAKGGGWFELAEDGKSFAGKWKQEGSELWSDWNGKRIVPRPGVKMLVVIEARWEKDLASDEFSFGEMLDSYFKRVPHAEVRERFFSNLEGFNRWCREIPYVAEPVILSISSHGNDEAILVDGKSITAPMIAAALEYAANLELVQFSACCIMGSDAATEIQTTLAEKGVRVPISGYAIPVPWGASATLEFAYFGMLLDRQMRPAEAARQLRLMMPHAGDEVIEGSVFPPMYFRFKPAPRK